MSYCDFHEGREAVSHCVNCGRSMCDQCSGILDGSGLCPLCRGEVRVAALNDPWATAESPWSTRGSMDESARRYIRIGVLGAILGLLNSSLSSVQLYFLLFTPQFYVGIILLSLPMAVLSAFIPCFLG